MEKLVAIGLGKLMTLIGLVLEFLSVFIVARRAFRSEEARASPSSQCPRGAEDSFPLVAQLLGSCLEDDVPAEDLGIESNFIINLLADEFNVFNGHSYSRKSPAELQEAPYPSS